MNRTILIIDDNMRNIQLSANVLKEDYKILYATNGEEGVERLKRNSVDLILLDIMMPKLDGFETARLIKSNDDFKQIPIIFLTANNDDESLQKAFEIGAVDFITKPFKPVELKLRVETHMELARTKQELQKHLDENTELLRQYKKIVDDSTIVSKSDLRGRITYVNEAFEHISGYTQEELIGKPHSIVRHPDMPSDVFGTMWKTLKNKEMFSAVIKNRHKDGSAYFVRSFIAPILTANGEISEYISVRQDITKEILSIEHEKQVNQLKDEFLRNMSHEIKTPLNAIVGFSSMLVSKVDDEKLLHYLETIESSAKTIATLMDNMVQLAQLKSGSYQLAKQRVVLMPILSGVMEQLAKASQKRDLDFAYQIDPALSDPIACDYKVIQWIVRELCNNAMKFTPSGGKIAIKVDYNSEQDSLLIQVKDNGIGIESDEHKKVFDLFYQVDGSTTRTGEGLGIGLSMVKQLAERLSGNIEIESDLNKGTLIRVLLHLNVE